MSKTIRLTNGIRRELENLHQEHGTDARAFRERSRLPGISKDSQDLKLHERVVILNDLHMGAGRDPETGRCHPGDDFTAQQERQFVTYLLREWRAAAAQNDNLVHPTWENVGKVLSSLNWSTGAKIDINDVADVRGHGAYELTLCLNGDFVDFLQTTIERPGMPYPDGFNKKGNAPKNTPANTIVGLHVIRQGHPEIFRTLAVHLRLGHKIDLIPGNHDRHFYNDLVWQGEIGTTVDGKPAKLGGFTKILEAELRDMGADAAEIRACLGRLQRKPFAIYADKFVSHGDEGDAANRVQRYYGELLEATPAHQEMPMALGDYGVRNGFNDIEAMDPMLDACVKDNWEFAKRAIRHPVQTANLAWGFLQGFTQEGYAVSPAADAQQRVEDVRALVEKFPYITEQLNALRPESEKLSKEQVADGLVAIEKASATPLFSNFKKGTGFFRRLGQFLLKRLTGKGDKRSTEDIYLDRLLAAHENLSLNELVQGHTHCPRDNSYLTEQEKVVRYVNTHTWMTQDGSWGLPQDTWGQEGRGVGLIETGTGPNGEKRAELRLEKVIGNEGGLVLGDLYDDAEQDKPKYVKLAREIYKANKNAA